MKLDLLKNTNFGERVAEDDDNLIAYFVETSIWKQLQSGKIDVIYGAKGSGKSALYKYLLSKNEDFNKQNIRLIPAENLKGATVFKQVIGQSNLNEDTFSHLWFIYILTLVGMEMRKLDKQTSEVKKFVNKLEDEDLLEGKNLRSILVGVRDYVISILKNGKEMENSFSIDSATGMPILTNKIILCEPIPELRKLGAISVYELLEMADEALKSIKQTFWITFDRLDVAFSENSDLEVVALKTLFGVYNDIKNSTNIKLKIFIRDDIWKRITDNGIREGSHITKQLTIKWSEQDFLFLLVSRIVENESICNYLKVVKNDVLKDIEKQKEVFYKIYPKKVEVGNNPDTFNWMTGRVKDGLGLAMPRELIHLLNESKVNQISSLEIGGKEDSYDSIISRSALKEALKVVSKVRLEQTIYQEYPDLKKYIKDLEERKTEQRIETLSEIYNLSKAETQEIANKLVGIGFFVEKEKNKIYWVPFLYRGGLNMIQGKE